MWNKTWWGTRSALRVDVATRYRDVCRNKTRLKFGLFGPRLEFGLRKLNFRARIEFGLRRASIFLIIWTNIRNRATKRFV